MRAIAVSIGDFFKLREIRCFIVIVISLFYIRDLVFLSKDARPVLVPQSFHKRESIHFICPIV